MKLDEMEFGRRLAVERELAERSIDAAKKENAAWDESGNFILYPSLVGIKSEFSSQISQRLLHTLPLSTLRCEISTWLTWFASNNCVPMTVVNIITNKVVRILGKDENHRFLNLALYQGQPTRKGLQTIVSIRLIS